MPTTDIARGRLAELAFADESSTYGTPASTGYRRCFYYSAGLRESAPLESDPVIGAGRHNSRDSEEGVTGLSEHGGQLVLPMCLNQIGDWLKLVFGAPATTGSTNFTHVFSSGANTLPTRTIELRPIASDFRQHVGCAASGLSVQAQDQGGIQRVTLDLLGFGENLLGSSAAGSVTAARAYDPMKATGGAVLLGGTQIGVLMAANFAYQTGLTQDRYVDGSAKFGAAVLSEEATLTGELRVRYTGSTYDANAVAETDQTLEFSFSRGANNSLSFLAANARLARSGVPIEGPGGIEQTIAFRCNQTTSAMLVATLKNQIATY